MNDTGYNTTINDSWNHQESTSDIDQIFQHYQDLWNSRYPGVELYYSPLPYGVTIGWRKNEVERHIAISSEALFGGDALRYIMEQLEANLKSIAMDLFLRYG